MGQIASAITGGINDVVNTIAGAVTDITKTAGQLTSMVGTISKAIPAGPASVSSNRKQLKKQVNFGDDPQDIGTIINTAMKQLLALTSSKFTTIFPDLDPSVTPSADNGLINNYCNNATQGIPQITAQIKQDCTDWQVPATTQMISGMASTICNEVVNKNGGPSYAHGIYSLTDAQTVYWVVAYGVFDIAAGTNTQGLVYAFSLAVAMNID